MIEHVAGLGNAAGEDESEAAQRIDILLDQAETFVERCSVAREVADFSDLPSLEEALRE